MKSKMRKIVYSCIPVITGVMLVILLFANPHAIWAESLTKDLAVPLTSSPKVDPLRKNITVQVPNVPSVSYSNGGYTQRGVPLKSSSSKVQSFGSTSSSLGLSGSYNLSSVDMQSSPSSSVVPRVAMRSSRVGKAQKEYSTTMGLTKRRLMGGPEPDEGEDGDGSIPEPDGLPLVGDYMGQVMQDDNGNWFVWTGWEWDYTNPSDLPQDTPTPIGDIPFLLLAALLAVYIALRKVRGAKG